MAQSFNMHSIKRAARKEAWYSDSWNPFRKNMGPRRASTWTTSSEPLTEITTEDGARDDPQSSGVQTEDQLGTANPDDDLTPSKLNQISTDPEFYPRPLEAARPLKDVEKQHVETISEPDNATLYKKFVAKAAAAWLEMKTQSKTIQLESSELSPQELFWDPYGSLSEHSIDTGYRDNKHLPHNIDGERALKTSFAISRTVQTRDVLLSTKNQEIGQQDIVIHHFQVKATNILHLKPVRQISDVRNKPDAGSVKDAVSSIFLMEAPPPSLAQDLSAAFECGTEVFNDHLKRASEDVEIVLPSIRQSQSHVVIPYRRTYFSSRKKEVRGKRNLRSTFSHGGLITTEEHVTCWVSPVADGSWTALILCDSHPILSTNHSSSDSSMHSSFESALKSVSASELLSDPHIIVRVLLRLVSTRWTNVIRDQEGYMLPGLNPQYTLSGGTDERLLEKESFGEYLKQTLGMLRMNLHIFQSLKTKSGSFSQLQDELLADYEYMANKVALQIKQNSMSIPVITAMIGIEESRKAIQQAEDVKALTTLATVYIPLSFVAGIFGMNVSQLNPNPLVNIPLWLYFATALPITAVSMLLVWHWGWLKDTFLFFGRPLYLIVALLFPKKKRRSTTNALLHAGTVGMAAGASDAFTPQGVMSRETMWAM